MNFSELLAFRTREEHYELFGVDDQDHVSHRVRGFFGPEKSQRLGVHCPWRCRLL